MMHAVILAGGSGTRFWPLSRIKKPKQFLKLVSGDALIVETLDRVRALVPVERSWVVCGQDHAEGVREALPTLTPAHLLIEPAARNTAPAIGLAAVHALAEDPDAVLLILPSDHHIASKETFCATLARAGECAQGRELVVLGIRPTRPETGFGYVKRGAERPGGSYPVEAFVEKPDLAQAQRYLQDSAFSWNAGIFVFRADALLLALARHLPKVHEALVQIGAALAQGPLQAARVSQELFPRLPAISIDYGVLEPESRAGKNLALVPGDFGWSDVGSFAALPEVRPLDARGNALAGDALALDCDDCVVISEGGRLLATLGLRGLCVIDSKDALLVVPRERAQEVRSVVAALKSTGRTELL